MLKSKKKKNHHLTYTKRSQKIKYSTRQASLGKAFHTQDFTTGLGSGSSIDILSLFSVSIHLHGFTQTCASKIAGPGLSQSLRAVAYPQVREQMLLQDCPPTGSNMPTGGVAASAGGDFSRSGLLSNLYLPALPPRVSKHSSGPDLLTIHDVFNKTLSLGLSFCQV